MVSAVAEMTDINHKTVNAVFDAFTQVWREELIASEKVRLKGIATINVVRKPGRDEGFHKLWNSARKWYPAKPPTAGLKAKPSKKLPRPRVIVKGTHCSAIPLGDALRSDDAIRTARLGA